MKQVSATLRNLQISPRKVRLVADQIRGASVRNAQQTLSFNSKNAARPLLKLLNSAVANADHNFKLDTSSLKVKAIMVGEGPTLKRFRPRAFGRATMLRKRMSHIKIVLEGKETKASTSTKKKDDKEVEPEKKETVKRPEKKQPKDTVKKEMPVPKSKQPKPVDPRSRGKERFNQHKQGNK